MKTLLTLVMAFSFSQIYAESTTGAGKASGVGMVTSSPDFNEPMSGKSVPYGETKMKAARKTNAKMNSRDTTSDVISTGQSSTTTTRKVMPSAPGTTTTTPGTSMGADCVNRSGQIFTNKNPGYTGCLNSMKMR